MRSAGQSYYYTSDAQGSVIALTDSAQALAAAYTYDPWGNTTSTGPLAATNPWTYATGYTDAATGYLKLGARYYNPTTGRFTQPDPSGQEPNTYSYASGNPANNTDPSGLDDVTYANQGTASSPPYDGGDSPIGSTECQIYVGTGSILMSILGTPISSYAVSAAYNVTLYGAGFAAGRIC